MGSKEEEAAVAPVEEPQHDFVIFSIPDHCLGPAFHKIRRLHELCFNEPHPRPALPRRNCTSKGELLQSPMCLYESTAKGPLEEGAVSRRTKTASPAERAVEDEQRLFPVAVPSQDLRWSGAVGVPLALHPLQPLLPRHVLHKQGDVSGTSLDVSALCGVGSPGVNEGEVGGSKAVRWRSRDPGMTVCFLCSSRRFVGRTRSAW